MRSTSSFAKPFFGLRALASAVAACLALTSLSTGGAVANPMPLNTTNAVASGRAAAGSTVPGSQPEGASPGGTPTVVPPGATPVGAASPAAPLSLEIALSPRDPAALGQFLTALYTPSSPLYHHYLAKGQFDASFGPARATVAEVRAQLRHAGLRVGPMSGNDLVLPVTTTVAKAEKAFGVRMSSYRLPSGALVEANTTSPTVPSAIAPYVQAVIGLDGLVQPSPAGLTSTPSGATADAARPRPPSRMGPDVTYHQPACAGATDTGQYTADDIAQAYDFEPLYASGDFGVGENVDLVESEGFSSSDVSTYQRCYGTHVNVVDVPEDGGNSTPGSEAAIDIEDVIGLAPGISNLFVYVAPGSYSGIYDDFVAIAQDDDAKVVSTSTNGGCESVVGSSNAQAENTEFEKMAAQGQTMIASSGDSGSEACWSSVKNPTQTQLAVDDPASQPYVTGVGGTKLSALGNTPAVAPTETAWLGSGGGISSIWDLPAWQLGKGVISAYSTGAPCGNTSGYCREVPDVSLEAGGTDYAMYVGGKWGAWWGTSLSAPTWAALIALVDGSSAGCRKTAVGFLNPALYALALGVPVDFNDITTGSNNGGGKAHPGDYNATSGYDLATGLGSPMAANLAQSLCGVTLWAPQAYDEADNYFLTKAPSAASSGQTLYVAGINSYPSSTPSDIYYHSFNGETWSGFGTVNPGGSPAQTLVPPAIAVNNGELLAAWTATTTDEVEVSSLSGGNWSSPVVAGAGKALSSAGPALAAYGGSIFVAWKGMSTNNLYLSINNGSGWGAQMLVPGASSLGSARDRLLPRLRRHSGGLDYDNERSPVRGVLAAHLRVGPVQTSPGGSAAGPALAVVGTTLYAAWMGTTTDRVFYSSLPAGKLSGTWGAEQTIPSALTLQSPALAVIGPSLYALWTGDNPGGSSAHLWYSVADAP